MKISFLKNEEIWRAADEFRESVALEGVNVPPIDVLYIVDVVMRFDLVDLEDLFADLRMDAAILPAEKTIFVDRDALHGWEKKHRWIEQRLRFSVAHELGHLVLHKDYMNEVSFRSRAEFKSWVLQQRSDQTAVIQADEFAGRFLVNRDLLLQEYDAYTKRAAAADSAWHEIEGMREHVARKLAPRFGVNHQVIETRLQREGIWPLE
jgi:Zn-dependent peptidase ImmA (M78 family)